MIVKFPESKIDSIRKQHKEFKNQIYKELYSNHIQAVFYICGWEVMIREAKNTLKEMGYDKKQIHFEKYD